MAHTEGPQVLEPHLDPHSVQIATKKMVKDAKDDDGPFRYPYADDEELPVEEPPTH